MDPWENCVYTFTTGDLDRFCTEAMHFWNRDDPMKSYEVQRITSSISEFIKYHTSLAFDDTADVNLRSESSQVISLIMKQIPRRLVSCDLSLVSILLVPVKELMDSEFADVVKSHEQLKQFYVDVDIFNQWVRMDPRMWSGVADAYRIGDQMTQAIQEEIEAIALDPDAVTKPGLPIRTRLNQYLRQIRDKKSSSTVQEFIKVFTELVDLYDLVDLETFISVFPNEIYLKSNRHPYKTSFARKLALTAVKSWVNGHQSYKKTKDAAARRALPLKEDIVKACISAHLNITGGRKDRDCEYLWSHLRKSWLSSVVNSGRFHLYEIYDHIEYDSVLVNQLLFRLEELNQTESIAELLTMSEDLRLDQRRRQHLEDPLVLMLMSFMQTARKDQWTSVFGPVLDGGFILPFGLNKEFRGDELEVDPESNDVYIIDQLSQLEAVVKFFESLDDTPTVAVIDVFYKSFVSARLERPIPSVVSVCVDNKVFILMANRMVQNSGASRLAVKTFFRSIFQNENVLKVISATRSTEKAFVLWTLIADDPFTPPSEQDPPSFLTPFLDLTDVFPKRTFPMLVAQLLGGIQFCDYEENSDWARADSEFLRDTQLHYIAARAWLSLQIFHTMDARNVADILPKVVGLNFKQVFGNNFYTAWEGVSEFERTERLRSWLVDNPVRLGESRTLVEESQQSMRDELKRDLRSAESTTELEAFDEFDITE